jgi:hypothetical protein
MTEELGCTEKGNLIKINLENLHCHMYVEDIKHSMAIEHPYHQYMHSQIKRLHLIKFKGDSKAKISTLFKDLNKYMYDRCIVHR